MVIDASVVRDKLLTVVVLVLLAGCTGMPEGVSPVGQFELPRYLGNWYEVARLDHSFERGLVDVSANYSMRDDGGVKVINRGFSTTEQSWSEAEGKAYFVGEPDQAHLKVSFFGPFYGSYVVFELDPDYQYAFISGNTNDYLWLLSRTPQIDDTVRERFIERANALGFASDDLIWVEQGRNIENDSAAD
ncbi:MAG: lipocalin family protein [Halioglobus sp.]